MNSGGWLTKVTKDRMNQTANEFNLGYGVYQKNGKWFVTFKGEVLPFKDGMKLVR